MPVSLFFVLHLYLLLKHNELKQLTIRGGGGSINLLYNKHRHKKALYHSLLITVRIYLTKYSVLMGTLRAENSSEQLTGITMFCNCFTFTERTVYSSKRYEVLCTAKKKHSPPLQLYVWNYWATVELRFFNVTVLHWKCPLMWTLVRVCFPTAGQVKMSNSLSFSLRSNGNNDAQQTHVYFRHRECVCCRWRKKICAASVEKQMSCISLFCLPCFSSLPPSHSPPQERAGLLPTADRISLFYYRQHHWQCKCCF